MTRLLEKRGKKAEIIAAEAATSTAAKSSHRRTALHVLIGMVLGGALVGIQQNSSGFNTNYMASLTQLQSSVRNLNNIHNNTSTSTTTIGQERRRYPNRTDIIYYAPARGRRDRSGAAIMDMLKAQAYSYSKGIAFGGACGQTPHQPRNEEMIEALGLEPILKYNCPPTADETTIYNNNTNSTVRHEMITRNDFFEGSYFTDDWLEYIHQQVQPQSKRWQQEFRNGGEIMMNNIDDNNNSTNNNNYTIAVHVRRGDVDPCGHWSFRYLPNSHYTGLIDHYKRQVPPEKTLDCRVYSESHSLIETFEDFEARGCQVILDGDPTEAWKTMLHANVVILSLSSFSQLPALLNPHGIIAYTSTLSEPLQPHWKWHVYKHSNAGWRHWIRLCDEQSKKR